MGVNLTKEQAVANLTKKFPKLDFSKFEYIDRATDSIIICPEHGEFLLNYRLAYLRKEPCEKCKKEGLFNSLSLSKENIIERLKEKFPKAEILDFNYKGYDTLITLVCSEHGENNGTVEQFLYKRNKFCNKCVAGHNAYDTEYVKKYIKEKYPDMILEKDFVFKTIDTDFNVTCPKHGEFKTTFYKCRVNRYICIYCSKKKAYNPIQNLEEKFPKLNFSKFRYVNDKHKSIVICPIHGEFETNYANLRHEANSNGCMRCSIEYKANKKSLDCETVVVRLKEKFPKLDFSKFEYKTHRSKSIAICPEHGEFKISYGELMYHKGVSIGCKKCSMAGYSKKEKEIVDYIKSIYNGTITENNRSIIPSIKNDKFFMELDIYLPELNLAIEFNGSYWHSNSKYVNKRGFKSIEEFHNYKTRICNEKNINLLHISEHDYDTNKEEVFKHISELIVKKD